MPGQRSNFMVYSAAQLPARWVNTPVSGPMAGQRVVQASRGGRSFLDHAAYALSQFATSNQLPRPSLDTQQLGAGWKIPLAQYVQAELGNGNISVMPLGVILQRSDSEFLRSSEDDQWQITKLLISIISRYGGNSNTVDDTFVANPALWTSNINTIEIPSDPDAPSVPIRPGVAVEQANYHSANDNIIAPNAADAWNQRPYRGWQSLPALVLFNAPRRLDPQEGESGPYEDVPDVMDIPKDSSALSPNPNNNQSATMTDTTKVLIATGVLAALGYGWYTLSQKGKRAKPTR